MNVRNYFTAGFCVLVLVDCGTSKPAVLPPESTLETQGTQQEKTLSSTESDREIKESLTDLIVSCH